MPIDHSLQADARLYSDEVIEWVRQAKAGAILPVKVWSK
jgi:hypothetical protein